ncbi:MAG: peptidoglycan DD-metalloendopeptidase family protein [Mycobacteriales bacterium]
MSSSGTPAQTRRRWWVGVLLVVLTTTQHFSPAGAATRWRWPLDPEPRLVRGYEAPASRYGPGHRGIDLLGAPGQVVSAVADGTVTFAGTVGGVHVVTVDHGGQVSTYQPVAATIRRGDRVAAGEALGRLLLARSHCYPQACLHLGRRIGAERRYADPMEMIGTAPEVRLWTPYGPPPRPPASGGDGPMTIIGDGVLSRPVDGPITSPYGMRVHPITGVLKLHDGTDFGVPCGTPVRAAAAGVVTTVGYDPAYGNRVFVDHGTVRGVGLTTIYNHLTAAGVRPGQQVDAGEVIATSGTTGYSTGCHLHLTVLVDGATVDPMTWL